MVTQFHVLLFNNQMYLTYVLNLILNRVPNHCDSRYEVGVYIHKSFID